MPDDDRRVLEELYHAAVAAADPARGVQAALEKDASSDRRPLHILALGKAGRKMCRAAIEHFQWRKRSIAEALVVTTGGDDAPADKEGARYDVVCGDHPVPGKGSFAAADRIGAFVDHVSDGDDVLVLLSGGTSSLMAGPVDDVPPAELTQLFKGLLGSGADIAASNAIRKRFSRWAGGRLAAALAERRAARVRCLIMSDVISDDPAVIGSGPCVADPLTARDVQSFIKKAGLASVLTPALSHYLDAVTRGELPETPKPNDTTFNCVDCEVILGNADAREGARARAGEMGLAPVQIVDKPIQGDAGETGDQLARELVRLRDASHGGNRNRATTGCVIWGGETTVHLTNGSPPGGRCQELALSAARTLDALGDKAQGISLLAGGTDGRDGPSDAAGAVVDAGTWRAIARASRDPVRDLANHDSHAALEAAHALLPSHSTGTNVADVVIGLYRIINPLTPRARARR